MSSSALVLHLSWHKRGFKDRQVGLFLVILARLPPFFQELCLCKEALVTISVIDAHVLQHVVTAHKQHFLLGLRLCFVQMMWFCSVPESWV